MKIKRKKTLLLCLFIGMILCFSSCDSATKKNYSQNNAPSTKEGDNTPCCEVTCRRGSCKRFASPCCCTCYMGLPVCSENGDIGIPTPKNNTSDVVIEASPSLMTIYDQDIKYVRDELHGHEAAEALASIKQLFIDNNYAISNPGDIQQYLENVFIFKEFMKTQSRHAQNRVSDMP